MLLTAYYAAAQIPLTRPINSGGLPDSVSVRYDSQGRPIRAARKDSLQHRDKFADSITIFYRFFDSTRNRNIDSSLSDFSLRLPQPYTSINLGNFGTASKSLLFHPLMKPGWDAGFHQYDSYNFSVENTRFYQTTRPYSELAYMLGNNAEQYVDLLHTQNKTSDFNFSFGYRFSNSPGTYKTQNASISDIKLTAHYQSRNRRYESFFIFISNSNASSENGGLQNVHKLDSLALNDPYEVDTRLGIAQPISRNPFNTTVNTGNIYKENILLYRHQYAFGQKDSLVTDSVTYKIFYPRFALQHTITIKSGSYNYTDNSVVDSLYRIYFNASTGGVSALEYKDSWSNITNEFSLVSYPDKKNQSQFVKLGAGLQNLTGTFGDTTHVSVDHFYNAFLQGEYRNRTKNNVWDIEANGQLYLTGLNSGDYSAYISLKRQLSKKIGYLQLGFQNVNKTPSFIFDTRTNFPVAKHAEFSKENITRLFAEYENARNGWKLAGEYYLVSNYAYFDTFFRAKQYATLFNVLHLSAEKKFHLSKHWNLYSEAHLQQTTGGAPLSMPFILTRQRLAYEGHFYTNLFISTGLEFRYYSDYHADNYSPFVGQFFHQESFSTSNRPDVNLFFHFRIKGFKGFLRLENINAINPSGGFSFNKYNYTVQQYPSEGLWLRFGIWWNFVN